MAYNSRFDRSVPDGNPLPGDDPDVTSPMGDPVPDGGSEPALDPPF